MSILRNSAMCDVCGKQIESKHRHDFVTHYCRVSPREATKWEDGKIVPDPGKVTFNFAVDGGKSYLRRVGEGFTDTSSESV